MVDENTTDDKETKTPADSSKEDVAENKGEGTPPKNQGDDTTKSTEEDLDKRIKEKTGQVAQLEETANDLTKDVQDLRTEKRDLGAPPTEDKPDDTAPDKGADKKVIDEALNIFYQSNPEFSPENDVGNVKYNQLDKHFRRLKPGSTVSEVFETLNYIKDTYFKKPEETKPDEDNKPDIGDTTSDPAPVKQNSALTRKLNKHEQAASQHFPGGEKAYREELAKKSK